MPQPDKIVTDNDNRNNKDALIVKELEQHASAVVQAIRTTVDTIRNAAAAVTKAQLTTLSSHTTASTTTSSSITIANSNKPTSENLYHQLQKAVDVDALTQQWKTWQASSNVHEKLISSCHVDPAALRSATQTTLNINWQFPPCTFWQQQDMIVTERQQVVWSILWPLWQLLANVYTHLDLLPTRTTTTTTTPLKTIRLGKVTAPPPPPPGLLSLQNYTDIAALMEFTICSSILVILEPHVLSSTKQRPLPKALQGRLPRSCLLWWDREEEIKQLSNTTTKPKEDDNLLLQLQRWYELQGTAALIAQVIVPLDRFRPMLLPRHVTDLFAALWQAQALQHELQKQHCQKLSHERFGWWWQQGQLLAETCQSFLPWHGDVVSTSIKGDNVKKVLIDDTSLAWTCLRLLQHGRQAPQWLQVQVSRTLQALAYRNLAAVMAVYCPVNDAGAPLRLAKTITTGPRKQATKALAAQSQQQQSTLTNSPWEPLLSQVVHVLDQIVATTKGALLAKYSWTEVHRSRIHTLWAILDQLPNDVLATLVLPLLNDTASIHERVRRWTTLFIFVPPFVDLVRMGRNLLFATATCIPTDENHPQSSIIELLWDLACAPSSVVVHNVQEDALYGLQLWSQAVLAADFGSNADSLDVFLLLLVHLLAPDRAPREFVIATADNALLDDVIAKPVAMDTTDMAQRVGSLEKAAIFAIGKLVRPLSQEAVGKSNAAIPSRLLQLLVLLYLSFGNPYAETIIPQNLLTPSRELLTMTLLPLLCEECSLESLVSDPKSSVPLLKLIGTVLQSVSLQAGHVTEDMVATDTFNSPGMAKTNEVVSNMLGLSETGDSNSDSCSLIGGDEESKLSIASVLLTLLVGLLELGASSRTTQEEEAFKSLAPSLKVLSETSGTQVLEEGAAKLWSELSEMASHANALIAARSASTSSDFVGKEVTDPILRQFLQAKHDLASPEPPVRARGVVALRHLTFVVVESSESLLLEEGKKNESAVGMSDVMLLSINALGDKESYVFLAAIQTIVAGAMQQKSAVQKLCIALAKGVYPLRENDDYHLSAEQRIKLAEALVGFVRRRASVNEHLDDILGTLFHATRRSHVTDAANKSDLIQIETHRYFTGDNKGDNDEMHDKWEETQLRVNTGGPVFDTEEDDIVRGAAINLVSEVARVASPGVLSRFVPLLVECAKVSLQLEAGRPVRRSGAHLAASLYNVVLRETEDQDPELLARQQLECPFTLAMVSSNEDSLAALISRVKQGSDVMDLEVAKGRRFDPATAARCREAHEARQQALDSGVLALAQLWADQWKEHPTILTVGRNSAQKADMSRLVTIMKEE